MNIWTAGMSFWTIVKNPACSLGKSEMKATNIFNTYNLTPFQGFFLTQRLVQNDKNKLSGMSFWTIVKNPACSLGES